MDSTLVFMKKKKKKKKPFIARIFHLGHLQPFYEIIVMCNFTGVNSNLKGRSTSTWILPSLQILEPRKAFFLLVTPRYTCKSNPKDQDHALIHIGFQLTNVHNTLSFFICFNFILIIIFSSCHCCCWQWHFFNFFNEKGLIHNLNKPIPAILY